MRSFTFATASVASALVGCTNGALYGTTIKTNTGEVVGYPAFNSSPSANLTQWRDIAVWKGIPFAASTGGENRWKAPQPATPWNTTLYASSFGDACPGSTTNSEYTFSEDCLNLNIWSAAKSSKAKLPVVMWSYPAESTARDDLFTGGGMADKDIVFVNYNYRTSILGWMAHPELSQEVQAVTGHNSSGNWGMLDQFAALKWIRENIENFGGDPDHITVMGQSAGSAATYHILNSPLTKGQIVGAIIESGVRYPRDPLSSSLAENYNTLEATLEAGVEYLKSLNVTSIAQARALPYTDFTESTGGMGGMGGMGGGDSSSSFSWSACLDGYAMPATYLDTLLEGIAHDVPVLTGNTRDESGAEYGLNITLDTYLSDLNSTFNGTWVDKFLDLYFANDSASASTAENLQWSERSKVGTWLWAQLWNKHYQQPIYNYFWNHAPPGQSQGAYHESEINYVLNNLYDTDLPWTASDYAIAHTMNNYWANFIKTGNPNGAGLAHWPKADAKPVVQVVGDAFETSEIASQAKIKLFKEWFATLQAY